MSNNFNNQELPQSQNMPNGYHVIMRILENFAYNDDWPEINEFIEHIHGKKKFHTPLEVYLMEFNRLTNKAAIINHELINKWYEVSKFYTLPQIIKALNNFIHIKWYKKNQSALKPITLLKGDNISDYINFRPKDEEDGNILHTTSNGERDYTETV